MRCDARAMKARENGRGGFGARPFWLYSLRACSRRAIRQALNAAQRIATKYIIESVLLGLIEAKVPEGKTIDYKRELPGTPDSARKDFLADLCSFANTAGGHLVYGMEEAQGIPISLPGLTGDMDQAIVRMESMARDGIRPPIPGLEFKRMGLKNGSNALVVIVPKKLEPAASGGLREGLPLLCSRLRSPIRIQPLWWPKQSSGRAARS